MNIYLIEYQDKNNAIYFVKRLNRKSITTVKNQKDAGKFTDTDEVTKIATLLNYQELKVKIYEYELKEIW